MKFKALLTTAAFSLLAFTSTAFAAGPAAKVTDLSWMTGAWAGNLGPNVLEENWILPEGGSLAAMVRMTGNGATSMFEVITIEEVEGSLVLHIQQWDAGFKPRTEAAQKMELVEIGDKSVKFKAVSEGGMEALGYSSPEAGKFNIHVTSPGRPEMVLNLEAR